MIDYVEMTEFVRFNSDGSSDHIRVMDGELFDSQHHDPAPYLLLGYWPPIPAGDECDWIVEVKKLPEQDND